MKPTRDEGNEVKVEKYKNYEIVIVEYSDDDYPAEKLYCVDVYADGEMVYEGDEDFERLYDAIDAGKDIIESYENSNEEDVIDEPYDYYGVKRSDFA